MKPLLVTGFEAFGGEDLNPTGLLMRALGEQSPLKALIHPVILPVAYDHAFAKIEELWSTGQFSGVLMFGQAGGRAKISLERVALNWVESSSADEKGHTPAVGHRVADGPAAIFSPLPLAAWRDRLEAAGIACEVSFSAGGFVCNDLYYQVARKLSEAKAPCLFVHTPYIPEQEHPEQPSMSLMKINLAARVLIEEMLSVH